MRNRGRVGRQGRLPLGSGFGTASHTVAFDQVAFGFEGNEDTRQSMTLTDVTGLQAGSVVHVRCNGIVLDGTSLTAISKIAVIKAR